MRKLMLAVCGLAAVALLSAGCSTTSVERVHPDGSKFKATNKRAIWNSKGVAIQFEASTNGTVKAGATIDQSGSSAETAKAIAEGIARGLKGE